MNLFAQPESSKGSPPANPKEDEAITSIDLRHLFEDSPVAFYTCNREGYINFFNKAAVELWGRTPELGKDRWCGSTRIYSAEGKDIPLEECPMAKTVKYGKIFTNLEVIVERQDGTLRNVLVFPRPILDEKQNLIGAHNTIVDITEQHSGQIKQETLSAIVTSSDDAIISKDLQGKITSWNLGAERIFKYKEEEVIGKNITILIPEERRNEEDLILNNVKSGRRIDHFETVRRDKYGREIPISLTVSPVKDTKGKVVGASKVARDISDRLQGEQKQAVLSAIVESSDDAIISKTLNGSIMSWNAGAQRIFGYTEEEVIGKPVTILVPDDRLEEEKKILENIKQGKRINHIQTIRLHKNGRRIPISLTVSPIKDARGNIVGASKISRDISEQVRTQKEIEQYAENQQVLNSIGKSISENMDVQVILQKVTDATTRLTGADFGVFYYNTAKGTEEAFTFTISGATREAFVNFDLPRHPDIFRPTFEGEAIIRLDDIRQDPHYGKNLSLTGLPEGSPPIVSYLAVPVITTSGEVLGGLFFGHHKEGMFTKDHEEIVENIAVQAAISLDNTKLFERVKSLSAKKDEFIALASHELKTPLTTIKGYLQVLARKEKDQMSEHFINKSLYQVNKLNLLVEDLLHMSRIEAGQLEFNLEDFDLKQMLMGITETFGYSHKSHSLIHDLGDTPALVRGDKQRIEQAIYNLVNNAVKYSPKADKVYLKLEVNPEEVCVRIKDEGIGLSKEQQKKLFTRFYRAENTEGISGLGIGLYLTKQIIDRHSGTISVKSTLGEGSEFFFTLPKIKKNEKEKLEIKVMPET